MDNKRLFVNDLNEDSMNDHLNLQRNIMLQAASLGLIDSSPKKLHFNVMNFKNSDCQQPEESLFDINLANGKNRQPVHKYISQYAHFQSYVQRRYKNNIAAKKSRDARKNREEEAIKISEKLQKENEILKAQLNSLKFEFEKLCQTITKNLKD
ncbi:hypothetical protein A3Q56_04166 [Intoshia linei]|uniref:BZIP domain-containing protein n=1 Tax=Intoshia linei TaxID=1819745 RepID=A0A177B1J9_9BILA|nr:hypothetical protein A3Q56_04166 [Intoshia linei]